MSSSVNAILYSFWHSSCAWRVRIALNLKKIPYEIKSIDLLNNEQNTAEIEKINPMKRVPFLLIDGACLRDSMNILYYLEDTRKNIPLLPADAIGRAYVRELCFIITSAIQPLQNVSVLNRLEENKRLEWAQYCIEYGFNALETLLSEKCGKYCFGDEITLADCCLVPQVANGKRFKMDLKKFPTIMRIVGELEKQPEFIKANAFNQPDTPVDQRI